LPQRSQLLLISSATPVSIARAATVRRAQESAAMRSLRRALLALAAVGFAAGAIPLALALGTEAGHQRELIAVFGPLTGSAFIGAGIVAWLRRPDNRVGALIVDGTGPVVTLPAEGSGRLCTPVNLRGERVAAIIHDASLENERELVRALRRPPRSRSRWSASMPSSARRSRSCGPRARLVESTNAARRRIERDLPDGAQQGLVALALKLRLVQERAEATTS
jgi:hypothetical protein